MGINNLVVGMTTKRQDGIVANGQRADFFDWSIDKQYHSGTQPNLYNQFIGIEILVRAVALSRTCVLATA